MSRTKRSYRSETKGDEDEDVSSDQSNSTNDTSAGHKKRHHKKSKKVRKHKSKRKDSSDSDSDSSNSSDNSSDAEIVKRKKQKKQKKSKRRHRHEAKDSSAADDSDVPTKNAKEAQKTHYSIDDDDERQRQKKNKRIDEMKKLRGTDPAFDEKGIKSKWDSPTGDDYDTKRFRSDRRSNDGDEPFRGLRRDRSRRSAEHRRVDEVPVRRVEPRRDDTNNRFNRRPGSRSRSRSVDVKRPRNPDYARERSDRDREPRQERAHSPQRDRGGDRGRFSDTRPAGGRGRRSPSPRNDLDGRRDGGDRRRDAVRRPNFGENRRGGELDSANNSRRDTYRRDGNDRDRGNDKRPYERNDDAQRSNNRDRPWRERERDAPRRNSRERERERRSSPPPRRDNPFRRANDSKESAGLDKHSNKIRHDERQDFRHGESRADRNDQHSPKRSFPKRERDSDNENYEWGGRKAEKTDAADDEATDKEKEKPNFGLSGKLTEDTNKVNGVVIKYAEPPEARRSKRLWRFYPFKGTESLQTIYLHRQSCYLIGRDKHICELTVDHPSCSKQHAAFQYRLVPYEREDGSKGKHVLPYIIDLESANGTYVNGKKIDAKKYVELRERDVVKFGFSTREYVLLHKDSKMASTDDDPGLEAEDVSIKSEPSD